MIKQSTNQPKHINTKAHHHQSTSTPKQPKHTNAHKTKTSIMSSAAQTKQTHSTRVNSSAPPLVLRPKGRERNARRELYDSESSRYMMDLRPKHEQSNTISDLLDATIDKQFQSAPAPNNTRKRAHTSEQKKLNNKEMFPVLGSPVTAKSLTWVTPKSPDVDFTGTLAPVPTSKKVKKKQTMQVLSKATTNDNVDKLNFQDERNELLSDIEKWKRIADERGNMLDDMEWEIGRLQRELEDAYDRCQ